MMSRSVQVHHCMLPECVSEEKAAQASMTDTRPLVSIGMPVYNGEKFLRRTLESLLAQDYDDFELIISDNASEDATQAICLEYAARDERIRYYRNATNRGMLWNFDRVFHLSSGEYFMWAGDHDLWDKSFISTCLDVLTRNPQAVLCYSEAIGIDANGKCVAVAPRWVDTRGFPPPERFRRVLRDMAWYTTVYGLMRARALKQTRLARNTRGGDIVLLCELSLLGEFHLIPKALFRYTFHPDEAHRQRTLRQFLVVLDPANRRRPLIMLFPTCTMVYNLLCVVRDSSLPALAKARLSLDVARLCIARWRDSIVDELRLRWLLQAIRFGRRLARRLKPGRASGRLPAQGAEDAEREL